MIVKLVGLIFLSCFPFLFTLHGDFVFDDHEAILRNKDIISESWTDCFYNDFWGTNIKSNFSHKSYRPLTILSFRINYFLNDRQLSAFPYKVTNLLCHVLCCILVWLSFTKILNTRIQGNKQTNGLDVSYHAAIMFAIHPIHTEAVCGVVGRADLLSGLTFFTSFLCYHKAITSHKYSYIALLFSIIMAGISMLFKEYGLTVLGFCLFYDFTNIFITKKKKNKHIHTKFYVRIAISCVSILVFLYGRWQIMGGTNPVFDANNNPAAFADNWFAKIATFNYIYYLNFLLLVWPEWLCYDWSMGCVPLVDTIFDTRIIFVLSLYVHGLLILVEIYSKRNSMNIRKLLLSIALIVIPFLPAANLFYTVGFVIAERVLYIPSAGYCLLVAIGLNKILVKSIPYGKKNIVLAFYTYLLLSLGLKTWHRSYDWQNEYKLFMDGLSVCPFNAKVHYNAAKVADANQEIDFALVSYREALSLYPEYYQAMNNLGNLLKKQKEFDEAEKYFREAIEHKHDFPAAWMNLGIVLANTKRPKEALSAYYTALKFRKNYPDCYYNLGNLYLDMRETDKAVIQWLHTVHMNPKHVQAWTNLIAILDNTEQLEKAVGLIPEAMHQLPDSPSVNFAVGNIYGKLARYEEAEQHFLKAIKLFGNSVQPIHFTNLGVLYHRWKKHDLAEAMYKNALKIESNFQSAINNLKILQEDKNKSIK